jgi:CheY-like chemotaxis protein
MKDQAAMLFSGRADACAVLIDLLIDKGIVSQDEVLDRLQRARSAGNRTAACELADIVEYLKPAHAGVAADCTALIGETVLLVESDPAAGEALQAGLERAGAEVLATRTAVEALPRIAQFDFSAAVVEWRPDTRGHRTLVRWLREDGVRLLYRADALPEAKVIASDLPVIGRSAPLNDVVAALARIAATVGKPEAGRGAGRDRAITVGYGPSGA